MKYHDVAWIVGRDGWVLTRTVGNHMQYRHPAKPGTPTLPGVGSMSKHVPPGTLGSILKQAGLK
jgi:predicted RNA binding protein YcfA (HicA-like mRNA interferase family)